MSEGMPNQEPGIDFDPNKNYVAEATGEGAQSQEALGVPQTSAGTRREGGPDMIELEELFSSFETAHSLAELNAITELSPDDAPNHPLRQPAKFALRPIVAKLNALKEETNISDEDYLQLRSKYNVLSRAVGRIIAGKVDHS